jgi:hypothetical protein
MLTPKRIRIGRGFAALNGASVGNVISPMKFAAVPCGSAPLRLHAAPAFRLCAPRDPRQRVVERDVANQVLRVVVARPGDVVGMRVLRPDVERVDAGGSR